VTRKPVTLLKLIALVVGLVGAGTASAQVLDLPPLEIPTDPDVQAPFEELDAPAPPRESSLLDEPQRGLTPDLPHHDYSGLDTWNDPACDEWSRIPSFTESTGTWLRRGYWSSEVDAVMMNRMWKRDDQVLAFDNQSLRSLLLTRDSPGAESGVRLSLGRFLFRDQLNRDHQLEFSVFGGSEFSQHDTLTSRNGGNTLGVVQLYSGANPTFDGSRAMRIDYDSRFASYELNYRVKGRPARDRMEYLPDGHWVRRTNKGFARSYLIGLRHFDGVDRFSWSAENISTLANQNGRYDIDTDNDMFGLQLGHSLVYDSDRWSIELMGKGGVYHNWLVAETELAITNDANNSFTTYNSESKISFLGEVQLIARYHLRPNLSLRAGWEMMYLTNQALAPDQLTFSPDEGRFSGKGDPFYNGALFGLEGYW
jgi:hypothetical protein